MKRLIFGVCISMLFFPSLFAQRSEAGVFAGGSFYLGDLNPSQLFSQTEPAFGAIYRYNLTTRWTVKGSALFGTVQADDAKFENPRALNFRSRITEFSLQAEVNFLTYFTGSERYNRFSPYLFGGVALFMFNPQGYYNNVAEVTGHWVDLRNLSTEGQGLLAYPEQKPYNTAQISFPFGIGFKFSLNRTFCIGVEWGMRKTFTDYLDDVSKTYVDPAILASEKGALAALMADPAGANPAGSARGDSNVSDWYSFAGITITAKIPKFRQRNCPAYRLNRVERIKRAMME